MDGSFQVEKGSGKGAQGLNQLYVSATFTDRIERQVQKIAGGGLKILKPDNYFKQLVRAGVNQKRVMVSRNHPPRDATAMPAAHRLSSLPSPPARWPRSLHRSQSTSLMLLPWPPLPSCCSPWPPPPSSRTCTFHRVLSLHPVGIITPTLHSHAWPSAMRHPPLAPCSLEPSGS